MEVAQSALALLLTGTKGGGKELKVTRVRPTSPRLPTQVDDQMCGIAVPTSFYPC